MTSMVEFGMDLGMTMTTVFATDGEILMETAQIDEPIGESGCGDGDFNDDGERIFIIPLTGIAN